MFVLPEATIGKSSENICEVCAQIKCHCFKFNFHQHCATKLLLFSKFIFSYIRMYNSKLQSVAKIVGTSDLSRTRYLLFRKEMFIFPRNETNGSPAPTHNNVAIDQVQIVMGEQHCFVEEGEMSNIYNKNLKNNLSVRLFLPLIVVVVSTGL